MQGDGSALTQPASLPGAFRWGTATSSYQIEGAVDVDGRGPSIWDTFCAQPGTIADGSSGAVACDHYHRSADDVALMADLGFDTYRFSIAWPRVIPRGRGAVNAAGLDFYDRLVDALLAAGIEPFPTLFHWDLPQPLQDEGGWTVRSTAEAFADYTAVVIERLGDRVGTWTTLNEPFVSSNHGHVTGEHAPGHRSDAEGHAAAHHLLVGHALAGERIRSLAPEARLAIVLNFTPKSPATDTEADRIAAVHADAYENLWFADPLAGRGYPEATADHRGWDRSEIMPGDLEMIARPIDLLGINYYTAEKVSADDSYVTPDDVPVNTMGWEIRPEAFGALLRRLHDRYEFPAYLITENGAPMPDQHRAPEGHVDDADRIAYLDAHIGQVADAIADGIPVEGYLVWSFLDNFEWAWGYGPTFGIVEVADDLTRIPKASAHWFADLARSSREAAASPSSP